jgi:DNA repair exonuclease SbcCD nuclease subunit
MLGAARPAIRVLLVADTHIGFDMPLRPRVDRPRRGHDFLRNFERALEPALDGRIDLVVHGGDLLDRSRPHPAIVDTALAPLVRVADSGVPVVLVPGNHERSRIPLTLTTARPGLHVFDAPGSIDLVVRGARVRVGGIPFQRQVRGRFGELVKASSVEGGRADVRLLVVHQAVEGATVGPIDYTFRSGDDVVAAADLPPTVACVLAGHIHRSQVLRRDLAGRPLAAPVVYPGSVERTSFAERLEDKRFVVLTLRPDGSAGGRLEDVSFEPLPARPMIVLDVDPGEAADADRAARSVVARLAALDPTAVVRLRLVGRKPPDGVPTALRPAALRAMIPPTMHLEIAVP